LFHITMRHECKAICKKEHYRTYESISEIVQCIIMTYLSLSWNQISWRFYWRISWLLFVNKQQLSMHSKANKILQTVKDKNMFRIIGLNTEKRENESD
jgi:hypothetical protein